MKTRLPHLSPFVATALVLLMAGCDPLHAPVLREDSDDTPEFNLAIPTEVMRAWSAAFSGKNYVAYEALLADEFEFFPRDEDANDFPWMTGDSWSRIVELEIVNNMFDPNFSGGEPPVTNITTSAFLQSQSTNGQGRPELTYQFSGHVLVGPADGFAFDTRIKIELVSVAGRYKIRQMKELTSFVGATLQREASGFASIKALYR